MDTNENGICDLEEEEEEDQQVQIEGGLCTAALNIQNGKNCGIQYKGQVEIINENESPHPFLYKVLNSEGTQLYLNSTIQESILLKFLDEGSYTLHISNQGENCTNTMTFEMLEDSESTAIAEDDEFTMQCESNAVFDILDNDQNYYAPSLNITSIDENASVFAYGNQIFVEVTDGYVGELNFEYEISDEFDCFSSANVKINVESCEDESDELCLLDNFSVVECNGEKASIIVTSQQAGTSIFYKLFDSEGELVQQNSTFDYPYVFNNIPVGQYELQLHTDSCFDSAEVIVECEDVALEDELIEEVGCIVEEVQVLDCQGALGAVEIYTNNPGASAFHRIYDESGALILQNSTVAYPVTFSVLPEGNYSLNVMTEECQETLEFTIDCEE